MKSIGNFLRREIGHVSLLMLCILQRITAKTYSIDNAPDLSNSDQIQIYYIQAPFPANAPSDIVETAGITYRTYGQIHGGIGIWDKSSDQKLSIDFYSDNYIGGLLPTTSKGYITWKNSGKIVINLEVDTSDWINARLITTTSGNAYAQLIDHLKNTREDYIFYQPVDVVYVNQSLITDDTILTTENLQTYGKTIISSTGSYYFTFHLIDKLGTYGCNLESFLNLYTSAFNYLVNSTADPTVVEWDANDQADSNVYSWYKALRSCYSSIYDDTKENGQGASYFLQEIKSCYRDYDYAYIYKSNTSVYKVYLANISTTYSTPLLNNYIYELPGDSSDNYESLAAIDYVIISLTFIAVIGGVTFFFYKFFGKKQRRRVSFEGEKVAMNVALNLSEEEQEDRAYYHGPTRRKESLLQRLSLRFSNSNSQQSGGAGGDSVDHSSINRDSEAGGFDSIYSRDTTRDRGQTSASTHTAASNVPNTTATGGTAAGAGAASDVNNSPSTSPGSVDSTNPLLNINV